MTVLAPPLDKVSEQATPYPGDMLRYGESGLCLFAAAYLGANDAIHMARKDMVVTCVDRNASRLDEMADLYPPHWEFHAQDAWMFAELAASNDQRWDIVSVDTFTGNATNRSMETLELWCSLAHRAVTATIAVGQEYVCPDGWRDSLFHRSFLASWLVLRRD